MTLESSLNELVAAGRISYDDAVVAVDCGPRRSCAGFRSRGRGRLTCSRRGHVGVTLTPRRAAQARGGARDFRGEPSEQEALHMTTRHPRGSQAPPVRGAATDRPDTVRRESARVPSHWVRVTCPACGVVRVRWPIVSSSATASTTRAGRTARCARSATRCSSARRPTALALPAVAAGLAVELWPLPQPSAPPRRRADAGGRRAGAPSRTVRNRTGSSSSIRRRTARRSLSPDHLAGRGPDPMRPKAAIGRVLRSARCHACPAERQGAARASRYRTREPQSR